MAEQLTPLDAAFLELEEGDESAHMHIGWAMVFDPLPSGSAPSVELVGELLEQRLDLLPRFRQRLSSPRTGRLSWPRWEPDPHFEIGNHVRRAALPSPGGDPELLDWLGDFYSHRLDRTRPLWEMTVLDNLADGRWAIAAKVHHSLTDGISGASVTTAILDAEPSPPPGSRGLLEALGVDAEATGRGRLESMLRGARAGADALLHPRRLAAVASRSREMAELLVRDELIAAPRTSLDVRIGAGRRIDAVRAPLEELKRVKRTLGGTVNDVVLAAAAGGLHRLFEARGEVAGLDTVRAMVPVSVRRAGEELRLGNRVSSLFVDLPVGEPDPLLRYHRTVAATSELKGRGQAGGAEALVELAGVAPPLVHGVVARLAFTPRLFNLTITNVPGPQSTLYALGAPVRRIVPLVPIFSGHALGVAAVSYDGEVTFGINADRASVPDLGRVRTGVEQSLADLGRLADRRADDRRSTDPGSREKAGI